jgi:hypothetical protein
LDYFVVFPETIALLIIVMIDLFPLPIAAFYPEMIVRQTGQFALTGT